MRLDDIITAISSQHIKIAQLGNSTININEMVDSDWFDMSNHGEVGTFYILENPLPSQFKGSDQSLTFLCYEKEGYLEQLLSAFPKSSIIVASDLGNLLQIKEAIQQTLYLNYVSLERLSEAYHAIFSGANFQQLAEIGTRIFGNPVFILDNLGNYIAFPPSDSTEMVLLQEERQRGRILESDLSELRRLKIDAILQETGKAYLFENPVLNHRTLVDFIRLNGTVLGRLMVYDKNKPITEGDRIVFMHFARIVALAFTHDRNYLMNKEASYSYFLQALVNRNNTAIAVGNAQIEEMKLHILHYKRVLLFSFIDEAVTETNRLAIAKQLQSLLGNALYMFHENRLVFLVSSNQKDFLQSKVNLLLEFCQITSLRLASSHIFYDFNLFRQMFQQASQVENIVNKYQLKGNLFSYRYLDSLITLDLHRTNHPAFVHPDILELLTHDQNKKSQLLTTLATYILFNQDIDAISHYLFVHPNTLRYRIKQIKKLLHNDLKDWLLLKTYYDSLVQLFQVGDLSNQDLIIKYDLHFL